MNNLNKKLTFLVNDEKYTLFKIALLSLHNMNPEKYPSNPSIAFRRLMQETIDEYNLIKKEV